MHSHGQHYNTTPSPNYHPEIIVNILLITEVYAQANNNYIIIYALPLSLIDLNK